ncbi:twin-arginine translocation pathway signal protein [uncultured Roseobacter sp.]|uniref:Acg family FMN-binding oxidoreductase n=1 Tax=uncultured Roseobacter sp. TaxID=114847 RepID=UPI0026146188|nr:twin-arginine translocation pathway signal protein [uncultured Roseobacter sp.]
MTLSRRKVLSLVGGGAIVAAAIPAAAFLNTRTPQAAVAPWQLAGSYADPRKNALSFALLAPNPHNLQPWKVELVGEDTVLLWQDTDKRLPETDPFDRQIIIGLGCFLEQMVLAAGGAGYSADVSLWPDGEEGPVARAVFAQGGAADPLAAHMLARRSCKEPFEARALAADAVAALSEYAGIITDARQVVQLKSLTWDAWVTEMETPRTLMESVDLMRFGKAEINASPDGIDLGGPFLETLMLAGVVSRKVQADPDSRGFQEGVKIYNEMLFATPAYAVLTSSDNSREAQIGAGRAWLRLNLKCTALGLSLHPVSQCLQEYPEMSAHYDRAHKLLAAPGETVQMLGRVGYGPGVAPSPRWPLEAKLLNG